MTQTQFRFPKSAAFKRIVTSPDYAVVSDAIITAALRHPQITSDDVQDVLKGRGVLLRQHNAVGVAMGHSTDVLVPTKTYVKSRRKEARGRVIQVWESKVYRESERG